MPYFRKERDRAYPDGAMYAKFVHYTSAENALKIIKSKRLWMRNTRCMADYREVTHGYELVSDFFDSKGNEQNFYTAFEAGPVRDAAEHGVELFRGWLRDIHSETYVASISKHDDKEDRYGRLSMWRAFGDGGTRAAIVLKVPAHSGASSILLFSFSPVAYLSREEVHEHISFVIDNIRNCADVLHPISKMVAGWVYSMLVHAVVCLKHEVFKEEQEWRVIYAPNRLPAPSRHMKRTIKTIGGTPQIIYELPLDEKVSPELAPIDLKNIFDRLIIGPSQYAREIRSAFVVALNENGVSEDESRVTASDISLRT